MRAPRQKFNRHLTAGLSSIGAMGDEEFAYRTDRPVEELRKELEDLAAGWTVRVTNTLSPCQGRMEPPVASCLVSAAFICICRRLPDAPAQLSQNFTCPFAACGPLHPPAHASAG